MARIPPGMKKSLFLFAVGSALLCGGCGRDIPEMVPVRGRVTLEGGAWPKPGIVDFTSYQPAKGFPCKSGSGHFGTDGSFVVKTGEYEGLMPGEYRIAVCCWEKEPTHDFPGKSYLPEKFSEPSQSGLVLKIEPGESGPIEWSYNFPRASR
jgi:hypothetical protein